MSEPFVLPPFPELEYSLLKQIVSKFNNWQYLEFEPEDLIQEVMIILIQKFPEWEKVRESSKSKSLIYHSLRNYAQRIYHNRLREVMPYTHEELSEIIKIQLQKGSGNCYDYFCSLPKNEQSYFLEVYVNQSSQPKKEIYEKMKITFSRYMSIELAIKQTARIEMFKYITEEFQNV